MLQRIKRWALAAARRTGLNSLVASRRWRRNRLLILCYHGISLRDEHEWNGLLYVPPAFFHRRMELLARGGYCVLPLDEALYLLGNGTLPPQSVVITFDDGMHDYRQHAHPILGEFGFPATVYQTTWYCDRPYAVFNLVLNYVLWRGRGRRLDGGPLGVSRVFDLSPQGREEAQRAFVELAEQTSLSAAAKDDLAAGIAGALDVDYAEIRRLRMFQMMNAAELAEIAASNAQIGLHTHRHRSPDTKHLFIDEIRENREWLARNLGANAVHFCYPSGRYREEILAWLWSEGVVSATTCEFGLAGGDTDRLLLPRVLDGLNLNEDEFVGWLSGVNAFIPHRRGGMVGRNPAAKEEPVPFRRLDRRLY